MALKVLAVYPLRCTGCRLCEQYCSWQHDGAVNPAKARITIHQIHGQHMNVPAACSQCSPAPCIEVCPEGAITRVADTGGLLLDETRCIGCRLCLESCPRGCIRMDIDAGVPLLCDLCHGAPECVSHCPESAIIYAEASVIERNNCEIHVRRAGWGREQR